MSETKSDFKSEPKNDPKTPAQEIAICRKELAEMLKDGEDVDQKAVKRVCVRLLVAALAADIDVKTDIAKVSQLSSLLGWSKANAGGLKAILPLAVQDKLKKIS